MEIQTHTTIPVRPSITDPLARIDALDFELMALKLADPVHGKGLAPDVVEQAIREYRRFMKLRVLHPTEVLVPTKLIDEAWHAHILDTRRYARDCQAIFGEFIHHYPYYGMRGDDDARNLQISFARTAALYEEAFGEPMIGAEATRCENHPCHAPSSCACRSSGACK